MKKANRRVAIIAVLTTILLNIFINQNNYFAFSAADYNSKELTAAGYLMNEGEEVAYDYIKRCNSASAGSIRSEAIEYFLDEGYMHSYIDEFKSLGYISQNYGTGTITQPAVNPEPAPVATPEPFTVETYNPAKTMWATQNVNCREGASTSYNKVGSLTQYDEVSVTGIASTGWYQVTKEDGSIVYVSNKYLTEEDPSNRTIYDYNEETGVVETIEITDTPPEIIDEIEKEIKATPEPTKEPTPVPTAEPVPEPTPTAEPVVEESGFDAVQIYYVAGAAVAFVILIIALFKVFSKKK